MSGTSSKFLLDTDQVAFRLLGVVFILIYLNERTRTIYNDLVDERLRELKSLAVESRQEYGQMCKEIEQIMRMDAGNFEQLAQLWLETKK